VLLNADVKGLEVVGCAWLSGDPTLRREILAGEDVHGNNQRDLKLPSRLIAKIFKFRFIYGGTAYSYANDPDFFGVSRSERYWQRVIDQYYEKYSGIRAWHSRLLDQVARTSTLEMPTGRFYRFERDLRGTLPETQIKNYPVQGLGADLVACARVRLGTLLQRDVALQEEVRRGRGYKLVNTVHDSIVVDTHPDSWYNIGVKLEKAVEEVPVNFSNLFEVNFDLPILAELKIGPNMKELKEIKLDANSGSWHYC